MAEEKEKLQQLLRELFQFNSADLDFGIYRIMNFKRDAIEKFIEKDLIKAVEKGIGTGVLASQSEAVAKLKEVESKIDETLGDKALTGDGVLVDAYRDTPLGKQYLELQVQISGAQSKTSLEVAVFNHLYTFFNRYYDNGDFLSKRRYSRKDKYAVPYNGEEVYLYWANSDQYYVKTGEYFNNYSFKSHFGVIIHFVVLAVDVEKDNVKGNKRFFVPVIDKVEYKVSSKEITIPFQYRPLTEQEDIRYHQRNQQDEIIKKALEEIPAKLKTKTDAIAALQGTHHAGANGQPVSLLEFHLYQYTRRNTFDYFVHKDLKGFLTRELDFYLKNEVLNLDEIENGGANRVEGWFQILKIIKDIGGRIIEFLAQIEDFQKRLFEKRKFILETQHCITIATIPAKFWNEIATCEGQWLEWKELLHLDEEKKDIFSSNAKDKKELRLALLKDHPTLIVDTKHFSRDFKEKLLGSFDSLDEMTDCVLIHGENFQALNLLKESYHEKVKCIHIDPPYNTQTSGFLYKNSYQHSSWLAMMKDRIDAGFDLLASDSAFLCHVDENEYESLHLLFERTGMPNAGTIVWDKKNPMLGRKGIATQHEYVVWRAKDESPIYLRSVNVAIILAKVQSLIKQYGEVNERVRREFAKWMDSQEEFTGGERAYRLIDDDGKVYRGVAMGAPEPRTDKKFHIPLIHPYTKKECPVPGNGWSRAPETLRELTEKGEILFGVDETVQPQRKVFLTKDSKRQISSVISNARRGKADVERLGLEFPYCHPVSLYEELLGASSPDDNDIVLDFFAGSGTNGHAVINLNREDGGKRKFILVEIGDYFDTVLLPRIKKVTFTPDWKDGKPNRQATPEEVARSLSLIHI